MSPLIHQPLSYYLIICLHTHIHKTISIYVGAFVKFKLLNVLIRLYRRGYELHRMDIYGFELVETQLCRSQEVGDKKVKDLD